MTENKDKKDREHEGDTRREDLGCIIVLLLYVLWSFIVGSAMEAIYNDLK